MPGTSRSPGLLRRGWRFLVGEDRAEPVQITDIQVGAPPGISTKGAKRPKQRQKPTILTYEWKQYRAGFVEPEYDLIEIFKALDTESYMRISFDKHQELILKNGWSITSQNPTVLEHVWKRLTEISWSQNDPLEKIIELGVEELVETHNTFYVLARKETGKTYTSRFGKTAYQISGLFVPSSATMRPFIITTPKGLREIREWWQVVGGRIFRRYDPANVMHFPFRRKKGNIFGTPYVIPVLDDILCLRRIEELGELVVHKLAFPFFQYKVGTDQEPAREYDDGHSEVDDIRAEVARMPFEGGIVTPHRHTIEVLGVNNKAISLEPYLKYYESRVLSGLNLSGIDIGRGETANRATAQTMSRGLADRCSRYQLFFAAQFTFYILDELVMELGLAPSPENRAYLRFPPIETEEARKAENHALTMYQGGLLSETEARVRCGMDAVPSSSRKDMHFARLDKPLALIKAVDEPFLATNEGKDPAAAKASAKEQPSNQYGKLPAKPRTPKNDEDEAARSFLFDWVSSREEMLTNLAGVQGFFDNMEAGFESAAELWMSQGLKRYSDSHKDSKGLYIGANVKSAFMADLVHPRIEELRSKVSEQLDGLQTAEERAAMFDSLWPVVWSAIRSIPDVAVDYAFARVAQVDKHTHVRWELTDKACEECKKASKPMKIRRFSWADLDRHDGCRSQLVVCSQEETKESS